MKVAIVGGGTKSRNWPHYDDTWEVWGLNGIRPDFVSRFHRMFNLHRVPHLLRDCEKYVQQDVKWGGANQDVPFYAIGIEWAALVDSYVPFPIKDLAYLPRGGIYHASSFDMMVAFAIHLKATAITIHGVDFHMESGEPISGRACLEYWLGVAAGLGIEVAAVDCGIFFQYHYVKSRTVYGYDDVHMIEDRA